MPPDGGAASGNRTGSLAAVRALPSGLAISRAVLVNAGLAALVWTLWAVLGGARAFQALGDHWPISLTMVFGSIVAGATAEGGGAVAFPVFTKLLGIPPDEARVFSLAIQSIGMTSASIVIIAMRLPVAWRAIAIAGPAGVVGLVIGSAVLVPIMPPPLVRIGFTLMVATLGIALVVMNRPGFSARNQQLPELDMMGIAVLAVAGVIGGLLVSLVGSGLDIFVFMPLVLLFRLCEKVATPTTVILMTTNTLVGFAIHALHLGTFTPHIQDWWLAAVPVVVLGAPLGAFICAMLARQTIAAILVVLIGFEVVSTFFVVPMSPTVALIAVGALLLGGVANAAMCRSRRYLPVSVTR